VYAFNYRRAKSVAEAAAAIAKDPDAKLLAGGQSLVATMKLRLSRPSDLVDLAAIHELAGIRVQGNAVTVGAMTRHADVAASDEVRQAIPALAALAGSIGDRQVRNMGTLGGSLAHNDPSADYPAAVLALGATVTTDQRAIPADEFFKGMYETALRQGEVITSVTFPFPKRAAYRKIKNPASRYAIVGVFIADTADGVRVAVTGAAPCVFRLAEMEKALASRFAPESVASIRVPEKGLNSDLHAKADYRAHLITVMARRAVEAALQ
jgi:aerobic carbon-monoxide dehydrogenase medium subunit